MLRELRLSRWVRPKKTGELHWNSDVSWTIPSTFSTENRLKRATPFSKSGVQSTKPQWLLCLRFPRWNAERTNQKKYEKGLLRPDGQAGFNTPTGKIELFSTRCAKFGFDGLPVYKPMMEPDGRFNLRMINGARKPYITHSKTRSDAPYLLELEPCSTITMHPNDASARGLADGDRVEIFSPFGGPVKANLEVSILVPPGTIDAQYGWKGEEDTQRLVPRQWDPLSGYAPYFEVNVEVRKVGSQK